MRNKKRIMQAFLGHQIYQGDCCGAEEPTVKNAFAVTSELSVYNGAPYPADSSKQGGEVLHLFKTGNGGGVENYVMGSGSSCVIPDGRTYEISMYGYIPTQPGTIAGDLRVRVMWNDSIGFHNDLETVSIMDSWHHLYFKNIEVASGCTFFLIIIYNQGGDAFRPTSDLMVDRMEMWHKGEMESLPGHKSNSDIFEDRMWSRTERLSAA